MKLIDVDVLLDELGLAQLSDEDHRILSRTDVLATGVAAPGVPGAGVASSSGARAIFLSR